MRVTHLWRMAFILQGQKELLFLDIYPFMNQRAIID